MMKKLLIANRGEITCRIIRTARSMGIATVAVYSDADARALHVQMADEAVHIGPAPAAESYLVGEKIIAAAKATGAEAIHPGYGFLSENAGFAQAVLDAGLIWVGPKPASIEAMGLKDAAKERMIAAGVPVTPGYLGEDQSVERLTKEADAIGYPVLIKAGAGGGGKGMRKVDAAGDFAAALESCRREAKASFSNDEVLLEKWITSPRHIEVQVFGDSHGNVVHLFERDCSLQRRHQKVIEEAPAPGMDPETREAICAAAVRAAKAVDYEGAGTIEFIADASEGLRADRIFFMEMNTRLQVEHPVTEEITGVDLVEWQLRVASGEPIPVKQDELGINGWAMEARLYAEDPAKGFLPSTGTLETLDFGDAYRIDTGVQQGAEVSPFYDPMIAKVIAHGDDREAAIDGLIHALDELQVWPIKTNASFLRRTANHGEFRAVKLDTGFIARLEDELVVADVPTDLEWAAAARFALADQPEESDYLPQGFRLNAPAAMRATLSFQGEARTMFDDGSAHLIVSDFGNPMVLAGEGDEATTFSALVEDDRIVIFSAGRAIPFDRTERGGGHGHAHDGDIVAPMPGKVIAVDVAEGDTVVAGQRLLVLEAMKMEHAMTAPFDGVVAELSASAGGQVQVDALLARIESNEDE